MTKTMLQLTDQELARAIDAARVGGFVWSLLCDEQDQRREHQAERFAENGWLRQAESAGIMDDPRGA